MDQNHASIVHPLFKYLEKIAQSYWSFLSKVCSFSQILKFSALEFGKIQPSHLRLGIESNYMIEKQVLGCRPHSDFTYINQWQKHITITNDWY